MLGKGGQGAPQPPHQVLGGHAGTPMTTPHPHTTRESRTCTLSPLPKPQVRDRHVTTPPRPHLGHRRGTRVVVTLSGVRGKNPRRAEQGRGVRCAEGAPSGCAQPGSADHLRGNRAARALHGPQPDQSAHALRPDLGHPRGRAPCTLAPSGPQTGCNPETHACEGNTATPSTMQPGPPPLTPNVDTIPEAAQPCGWATGLPSPGGKSRSLRVRGGTGLRRSPRETHPRLNPNPALSQPATSCPRARKKPRARAAPGWAHGGHRGTDVGQTSSTCALPTPQSRSQEVENPEPQLQTGEANGPWAQEAPETAQ